MSGPALLWGLRRRWSLPQPARTKWPTSCAVGCMFCQVRVRWAGELVDLADAFYALVCFLQMPCIFLFSGFAFLFVILLGDVCASGINIGYQALSTRQNR